MLLPSACRTLAAALAFPITACTATALDECASAYQRAAYPAAIDSCRRGLSRTDRIDIAGKLAWSQFGGGRATDARALTERYGVGTGLLLLTRAAVDWRSGKVEGAAGALERAREQCRSDGDPFCSARAALELAALRYTRGDYRAALAAANQAASEPAERDASIKPRALLRLFDVLYELGDSESAGRVLTAATELHALDAQSLPYLRIKEANLRALEGRTALARQAHFAAIEEAERADVPIVVWSSRLNLVKLAAKEGRLDEARVQLSAAEALFPRLPPSGNSELALHFHRALVLHARREWDRALGEIDAALVRKPADDWIWELQMERALIARDAGASELVRTASLGAIQAAERMRDALGADELKAWLLPSRRRPFELLFQAQAEAGEGMAALQTAERALARTFLDAFVEAHTLQGAADPVQAGSEAVTRADSLRAFIPVLRQSHVVATRPLAEVLPKLGDRHVLLYFATAEAMWLIQVAEQRVRLERLATSIAELQLLVDRFLRDPGDASAADELGTLLLPADVVLSKTELTLISTGPIAGLPFAALRRAGRTLVQDHVVHYVPSLSALAAIAEASTDGGGAPVVIGDARGDLPGARAEAVAVANELRVAAFLGAQASRDAVRAADRARVLHMAVHGGIGIQGAWLQLHDGELTSSDVLQWKLRPRLVVLTACASSATRARELWGSMSASFLAAGSRAVLASLWSVDDGATRALAERFYVEGGARQPSEALASAQRRLAAGGMPASAWAAFIVLGE